MKRCSTAELRQLEIINLCDGTRLGYACDFEFDREDARILALVVPRGNGLFCRKKEEQLIIPWCKIECIGEDTILVKLSHHEISSCCCESSRTKRGFF